MGSSPGLVDCILNFLWVSFGKDEVWLCKVDFVMNGLFEDLDSGSSGCKFILFAVGLIVFFIKIAV